MLMELVYGIGARPVIMDPERHDRAVASISHLPYLVAIALVETAREVSEEYPETPRLAAGGFKDITRIASRDPIIGADICATNEPGLSEMVEIFRGKVEGLMEMVKSGDVEGIRRRFGEARAFREGLFRARG